MDANESMSVKNSEIQQMIRDCKLINAYSAKHGEKEFGTHINGSKRIDFIICNEAMLEHITSINYMLFHQAIDSDHRACYCDISETLFKNNKKPQQARERLIGTNSTNGEGEKYIRHLDMLFKMHRIYDKVETLSTQTKEQQK
jgi:hypothetical protein